MILVAMLCLRCSDVEIREPILRQFAPKCNANPRPADRWANPAGSARAGAGFQQGTNGQRERTSAPVALATFASFHAAAWSGVAVSHADVSLRPRHCTPAHSVLVARRQGVSSVRFACSSLGLR